VDAESLPIVELLFSGDPSPGTWLCAIDMDPADTLDLRVVGVVHSSWAPAPEPHSNLTQFDLEQLDVHTTEDATEQPTLGPGAEPEGAYVPDEDLYFFDASPDAWLDRDDDDDCFFDSHDDRQGVFVKSFYFYDARSDFLDLDDWMASRLGGLAQFRERIVKQWQQAYMHLAQPMFALSCMLWEAMDVSKEHRGSVHGSRHQRRS
jgi:hypothetical protein